MEKNDTNSEETAKRQITVTDGGDFGFSSCGKCGERLPEHCYDKCPFCGIKLVGSEVNPSFGGSDF